MKVRRLTDHEGRQFHGCYSIGDDVLWGVARRQKSAANVLAALETIPTLTFSPANASSEPVSEQKRASDGADPPHEQAELPART